MNIVDVGVVALVVAAGWGGYQIGFVARSLSWIGMVAGLVIGARLAPIIVGTLDEPPPTGATLVGLMTLLVCSLVGQVAGLFVGTRVRDSFGGTELPRADRIGGAVIASAGVLFVIWVVLPTLAESPTTVGRLASESASVEVLPQPPDTLRVLRRVIEPEGVTRVVSLSDTDVGPPPALSGLPDEIVASVERSVVLVQSQDCGRIQTGTGFVAGDSLVVTNAHVVAGTTAPTVERDDGEIFEATVAAYDPGRDVAVLIVPDLDRPALPRAPAEDGMIGGVFGHPGGEALVVSPFRVEVQLVATGSDLYGADAEPRAVLLLAAQLEPGDSGAPLIDVTGSVVGLTFAVAPGGDAVAYALTDAELSDALAELADGRRSSGGPCISESLAP